jgi:hypothetical protein
LAAVSDVGFGSSINSRIDAGGALLAGRTASAQSADVTCSSWPIGFYSNLTVGQGSNIFGGFAGFDGSDARGFSTTRINFPNGWFVGGGASAAEPVIGPRLCADPLASSGMTLPPRCGGNVTPP